jgi:TRAP-type C4-dicarboxylate transport system permease small subunit
MNASRIAAIVLIAAGVLGLIYHGFSYTKDSHEAKLGSLELSLQHKETVDVPEWLSVGAIVAGAALLLFGARKP